MKALAKRTNPKTIAVFPLEGNILLPGCDLPLNIFEPRYLNMVDDALKQDRLIGMIRPQSGMGVSGIGGLGRIVQFAEAEDGRYMIVLHGLKRFVVTDNVPLSENAKPYQLAHVSYAGFEDDINIHSPAQLPEAFSAQKGARTTLITAMKSYADTLGVKLDWQALKEIPLPRLIDQAAMISPFSPEDKQSLLEVKTHEERRRLLIGLLHLYAQAPHQKSGPTVQ